MKKSLPRELLWMTLPVALLGGTAWWVGSDRSFQAPVVNMSRIIATARRPSLSPVSITAKWISPTRSAFLTTEESCHVDAFVATSASLVQVSQSNLPAFASFDIVDDKGHSIKATLSKPRLSLGSTVKGISTATGKSSVPGHYGVSLHVPFFHLPRATRSATLIGTIGWGTAMPVPIKIEVLPMWMRRPATRLRVQSVAWRPYTGNKGSQVNVVCRISKPHNPYVFGLSEDATMHTDRIGIGYDPEEKRFRNATPTDDVILGEWSQRIESGDGKLNSLDLRGKHMRASTRGGYAIDTASGFDPLCKVSYAGIKNDLVRLEYDISGVPITFKSPVFRCEIYLVGDGMVNVRCPLKTKSIKESR